MMRFISARASDKGVFVVEMKSRISHCLSRVRVPSRKTPTPLDEGKTSTNSLRVVQTHDRKAAHRSTLFC
jgi:hypothetical protein